MFTMGCIFSNWLIIIEVEILRRKTEDADNTQSLNCLSEETWRKEDFAEKGRKSNPFNLWHFFSLCFLLTITCGYRNRFVDWNHVILKAAVFREHLLPCSVEWKANKTMLLSLHALNIENPNSLIRTRRTSFLSLFLFFWIAEVTLKNY